MESVVVAINARGDIMFITTCLEKTKKYLRDLGHHPLRNCTNSLTWYDAQSNFVCGLRQYDVGDL